MPVLDWTRTDLTRRWPDGSEALAYDADDLAAFDLFILKRDGAEKEYEAAAFSRAKAIFEKMTEKEKETLQQNIIAGLPGRMVEAYTVQEFRQAVAQYKDVSPAQIRENLAYFLKSIIPVCEEAGVYMAIHPDDPPRPILGLPPACSTRDDVAALLKAAGSKHNGITLCVGTYASSPQNKALNVFHIFSFLPLRGAGPRGYELVLGQGCAQDFQKIFFSKSTRCKNRLKDGKERQELVDFSIVSKLSFLILLGAQFWCLLYVSTPRWKRWQRSLLHVRILCT